MAKFNKNVCLNNIYMLAEKNNVKISDLEAYAGMSTGFLSRAKKTDARAKLPLEGIVNISEKFNVPLDIFLSVDLSSISETDKYQLKLLNKLIDETTRGVLDWKVDSYAYMETVGSYEYDEVAGGAGLVGHPLYEFYEPADELYYDGIGETEGVTSVKPEGDFFHATVRRGLEAYIADVEYQFDEGEKKSALEVWLVYRVKGQSTQKEGICSSIAAKSFICDKINMLHNLIGKSIGQKHLSHRSRTWIDAYVGE